MAGALLRPQPLSLPTKRLKRLKRRRKRPRRPLAPRPPSRKLLRLPLFPLRNRTPCSRKPTLDATTTCRVTLGSTGCATPRRIARRSRSRPNRRIIHPWPWVLACAWKRPQSPRMTRKRRSLSPVKVSRVPVPWPCRCTRWILTVEPPVRPLPPGTLVWRMVPSLRSFRCRATP